MRHPTATRFFRPALATLGILIGPAWAVGQTTTHKLRLAGPIPAETPVILPAPAGLTPGLYSLNPASNGPAIPAVVLAEGSGRSLTFIAPSAPGPTDFTVAPAAAASGTVDRVSITADGPNLKFDVDGSPVTLYRVDGQYKPFLFPVLGPSGSRMTRSYPMEKIAGDDVDHPHHESFWFTHGKVNGIDFWDVKKGLIKETARTIEAAGPVLGRLRTRDDWVAPDGAKVCEDERVLTVYATKGVRIIDFDVTLKATDKPVVMGETKEGSFGLRVASSMDVDQKDKTKKGGRIVNAEGLKDAAAWGKPSAWVDYSGPVDGKAAGITIMDHPRSFRHPTTWHVRTYGLFAANPFGGPDFKTPGYGEYTIAPGDSIRFAYRVILHDGEGDPADIARRFALYAEPPTASWDN